MNLTTIFSTPIWQTEYPEFEENKAQFTQAIRDLREKYPEGVKKSNLFGYHSPENIHEEETRIHPLLHYVGEMVLKAAEDIGFISVDVALTSVWFNINDSRQCMNAEHTHGDTFSGVFYLKTPEGSGKLVLQNPGINRLWSGLSLVERKNQFTGEKISIAPIEGNIILFPSYLPHWVEPNDHDDERISISFNAICLPEGSLGVSPQQND
jgi:uncharacterized protein (TIGR02466 family)